MQNRIFELLECVAKNGPITLDQLAKTTGISRSATFRGLKRLEDGGWIRLRLNGRQYVLTSKVEQKLNAKIEPKKEIEQFTPIISRSVELRSIRVRIFQQQTTATTELVDDSEYNSSEQMDHAMAIECSNFLLRVLQYAGLAVGKSQLDAEQRIKAADLLRNLEFFNFTVVSEQRFLWLPVFSQSSEVFFLCLSRRDFGLVDGEIAKNLVQDLKANERVNGFVIFQHFKRPQTRSDSEH